MSAAVASDRRITGAYWKDISCGRVPIQLIPWISRGGVEIFLCPSVSSLRWTGPRDQPNSAVAVSNGKFTTTGNARRRLFTLRLLVGNENAPDARDDTWKPANRANLTSSQWPTRRRVSASRLPLIFIYSLVSDSTRDIWNANQYLKHYWKYLSTLRLYKYRKMTVSAAFSGTVPISRQWHYKIFLFAFKAYELLTWDY